MDYNLATLTNKHERDSILYKCKALLISCLFFVVGTVSAQTVHIPDWRLQFVIERTLGKAPGATITAEDMATLTQIDAEDYGIKDLTGIELAINLTQLILTDNKIKDISPLANLIQLEELHIGTADFSLFAPKTNQISDITPLSNLTRLKYLYLGRNQIRDITPLANLIQLERVTLASNQISDITPLTNLTQLKSASLHSNKISDITPLANLTQLTNITLASNQISDITPLANLTRFKGLNLYSNKISDITPLANLTQLDWLRLSSNQIRDISPLANLTLIEELFLRRNQIGDVTPLANLTRLEVLELENNQISDIAPLANLTLIEELKLSWNQISDITPLTGLVNLKDLELNRNPIQDASPLCTLREQNPDFLLDIDVTCTSVAPEYLLSVPAGTSLIHIPLKVTEVDGTAKTIRSIADLYDTLGGADAVNFLLTYDSQAQEWRSYFGVLDKSTPADRTLTDDMGIIAVLKTPVSVDLRGGALGTNGTSTITLNQGLNLVGLPLKDSKITRVSDLLALEGIRGNVTSIIVSDNGGFKVIGRAGDDGDIPITGGQSFILTAHEDATIIISGGGWNNTATR